MKKVKRDFKKKPDRNKKTDIRNTDKIIAHPKTSHVKNAININGSFLYLLPENVCAMQLHDALGFMDERQLEVWKEINLLEVTAEGGTITFEDMMGSLRKEDTDILDGLGMKKVYAVDYSLADKAPLYKAMEVLTSCFGGKIGSDTEDFEPFINIRDI